MQPLSLTIVTADQIKDDLISRLRGAFPNWSDDQDSNSMVAVLEQIAVVAELNYGYINRMTRESFLQFAVDPKNVVAHARGLGYIPKYQSPSFAQAVIVSAFPVVDDTVIPAGTKFSCALPLVVYETTEDLVISSGTTQTPVTTLKQQESWVDEFIGTGQSDQLVQLNRTPTMPDTIQVFIDGVEWSFVEDFIEATPTSKVYTWTADPAGVATVFFGNGVNGQKVGTNAAGKVFYKTGGGKSGVVGKGQLGQNLTVITDPGNGQLLSLTAVNADAGTPGSDAETTDQIRKHAVASLRAPKALLTAQDVEDAVESQPGVLVARGVNWEINPALPHHLFQVYIVPNGMGQPSVQLVADITRFLTETKPVVMGHQVSVLGPTYNVLNFQFKVSVKTGFSQNTVNNSIRKQLTDLFDPTLGNIWGFSPAFGMGVFQSQIIAVLQQVDGVKAITMLTPGDIQLNSNEFPQVGTITFV